MKAFPHALRRLALLLIVTAGLAVAAHAQAYSKLYVFGDSLSDVGNDLIVTGGTVPSPLYYSNGRFSNGPNYADDLSAALGLGPLLPSKGGGTDYAFGGALTNSIPIPNGQSFSQQIADYAGNHALADPNALYLLWIGANDLRAGLSAAAGDPTAIQAAIGTVLSGIGGAMQTLASHGATHFLVPNMPDLSLTPAVRAFNNPFISAGAQQASIAYNTALTGVLTEAASLGLDVRTMDVFGVQTAATNNPAAYGLSNVTQACYSGDVDGAGTPTLCGNPDEYLYFDYIHPTAAVHELIGAAALAAAVPEPATWLMLIVGIAGLAARSARRNTR